MIARARRACTLVLVILGWSWATLGDQDSSYDYGFDVAPLIRRQESQPVVVSRLATVNGSLPVRPEIRQMKRDVHKWNLFLLALSMMQYTDQDQELSWYQITGIHGVPFVPWNGVKGAPNGNGGYCTHTSILFPSWHRPYLALYEQILFNLVTRIASWFPDPTERALYEAAANDFRIPYWDWAVSPPEGESAFLHDFRRPSVRVYGPNGLQTIANPLFSYRFRPLDPGVFDWEDFPHWTETKRAPVGNTSRNNEVAHAVDRILPSLQERLFNLFSNYPDYGPFSNKNWGGRTSESGFDSLESLHDEIHIEVGNLGHLYYIQYSAFDPIFFLHHAMVDRIVAMWQILHPFSWVTEQATTTPTFTLARGVMQNSSTDLAPFYAAADGVFWNSETARYTRAFGYSYPEIVNLGAGENPGRNPDDRARLSSTVNRLYGSSSLSAMARRRKRSEPPRKEPWLNGWLPWAKDGTTSTDPENPDLSPKTHGTISAAYAVIQGNRYTEWLANVRVTHGALNGSFSVHFFLGPPAADHHRWRVAPNLVGTMGVFAMTNSVSENQICGTVPLTSSLVRMVASGALSNLNAGEAQPYLIRHLQFRVAGPSGEVDPTKVKGLCVEISSSEVEVAEHDWELPNWGPLTKRFVLFC